MRTVTFITVLALGLGIAGVAAAQNFIGPCAGPPNGSCGLIVGSTTRAFGLATTTFYSTQSSMIFKTLGGSNQNIVFLPNGNVGIASSSPGYTLTVNGTVWATSYVGALSGSMTAANVTGPAAFGSNYGTYSYAFPSNLAVATATTAGLPQALTVAGGGYFTSGVGIGVSNPGTYALNVNGTANFSNQVNIAAGGLNFTNVGGNGITMNGQNIGSVGKLTVTTVDPLYSIGGDPYATYGAAISGGVYEEYVGHGVLTADSSKPTAEYVIDFSALPTGSDLWVWRHVVDFSPDTVSVFLTPIGAPALLSYEVVGNRIVIRGDRSASFAYRLIGKRFDWRQWPTAAPSAEGALVVPER